MLKYLDNSRNSLIVILFALLPVSFIQFKLLDKSLWLDEKFTLMNVNGIDKNGFILLKHIKSDDLINTNPHLGYCCSTDTTILNSSDIRKNATLERMFIANTLDNGGNNLVYFFLLYLLNKLVFLGPYGIRIFSLFFWALSLILIKKLAELVSNKDPVITVFSVLFFLLHPLIIKHSVEARAYSFTLFMSLCIIIYFYKFIFHASIVTSKSIVGFIVLCFLCVSSHYLMVGLILPLMFFVLYKVFKSKFNAIHIALNALVGILLCLILYYFGKHGLSVMAEHSRHYEHSASLLTFKERLVGYFGGCVDVIASLFGLTFGWLGARSREYVVVLILLFSAISFSYKKTVRYLVIPFFGIVFLTLLAINSGHSTSFNPRYLIWYTPFVCIVFSYQIKDVFFMNKKNYGIKKVLVSLLVILFVGFSLSSYYDFPFKRNEDGYKKLTLQLQEKNENINKIVSSNYKDAIMLALYLKEDFMIILNGNSIDRKLDVTYSNDKLEQFNLAGINEW